MDGLARLSSTAGGRTFINGVVFILLSLSAFLIVESSRSYVATAIIFTGYGMFFGYNLHIYHIMMSDTVTDNDEDDGPKEDS